MNPARQSRLELDTAWGTIVVLAGAGRIVACHLPQVGNDKAGQPSVSAVRLEAAAADRSALKQAERFIRRALAGVPADLPPLQPPEATAFTTAIWRQIAKIPAGKTLSYAGLAKAAGRPGAARAAGSACGRNALPLFIPCHRVLAAGGRPGGFTGGLAWKRWLLAREREAAS